MSIYTAEDGEQEQGDVKKAKGAFRTISEVADRLGVQQHVLRFWETKFSQVKPLTRGGGRRYYRPEDVAVLEKIYNILYKEGYTIKGAQKLLKGLSKGQIAKLSLQRPAMEQVNSPTAIPSALADVPSNVSGGLNTHQKAVLESMLGDLKEIRDILKK